MQWLIIIKPDVYLLFYNILHCFDEYQIDLMDINMLQKQVATYYQYHCEVDLGKINTYAYIAYN